MRRPAVSFTPITKSEWFFFRMRVHFTNSFDLPNHFRHDDLKQMLDSNKDHLKLEAMKRIIGMVAKVRRKKSIQISEIFNFILPHRVAMHPICFRPS